MTEIRYHRHLEAAADALPNVNPSTAPLAAAWPIYAELEKLNATMLRIEALLTAAAQQHVVVSDKPTLDVLSSPRKGGRK